MMSPLLNIKNLRVQYHSKTGPVHAVIDCHLQMNSGQITCIVGESGSGKTSIANALLRNLPSDATVTGKALFRQTDLIQCDKNTLNELRGKSLFFISQNPINSFNPSIKMEKQLYEIAGKPVGLTKTDFLNQLHLLLTKLHFFEIEKTLRQYPFQLSGGMLQRLSIACAFLLKPSLIIADEPTSSLDMDVQKQILQLINESKHHLNISYLIVTHDLGVVAEVADHVVVMKTGRIIEQTDVITFFNNPQEPYSKRLLQTAF